MTSSTRKFSVLKSAIVALSLAAVSLSATTANAGGFSFGISVGGGEGPMMVDSGFTVGDRMDYPLIADGDEDGPGVLIQIPLGGIKVDVRAEKQHAHDCRALKEAEAEWKLLRKH